MMKNKHIMLAARNRTSLLHKLTDRAHFNIFRGTSIQGGGKKGNNSVGEAQDIMNKIFANATPEDSAKRTTSLFAGSGTKINLITEFY